MPLPYQVLKDWVDSLNTLRSICGDFNQDASTGTLNAFAKNKISIYITGTPTAFKFGSEVRTAFKSLPPGFVLDTSHPLFQLTDDVDPPTLRNRVLGFVAANCSQSCIQDSNLNFATALSQAYPGTTDDQNWLNLINGIHSSNLDSVLASDASTVASSLGRLFANQPAATLLTLVDFLSTVN